MVGVGEDRSECERNVLPACQMQMPNVSKLNYEVHVGANTFCHDKIASMLSTWYISVTCSR